MTDKEKQRLRSVYSQKIRKDIQEQTINEQSELGHSDVLNEEMSKTSLLR